ncbi:hypothetical protein N9082_01615 [Akkermansiaceae bacterium]|nr:hypothetical protein [Akkermansiaceae bacterium]
MTEKILRKGLFAAVAMNIGGVLLFSKGLTNEAINEADPVVMSNFGLVMIMVWGLAYAGAAAIRSNISWLLAAFAIEKLIYGFVWVKWLSANSLSALYEKDLFAGIFYSIYGFNDLTFMLFFAWAFVAQRRES